MISPNGGVLRVSRTRYLSRKSRMITRGSARRALNARPAALAAESWPGVLPHHSPARRTRSVMPGPAPSAPPDRPARSPRGVQGGSVPLPPAEQAEQFARVVAEEQPRDVHHVATSSLIVSYS